MDIVAVGLAAAFLLFLFWGLGVVARHYRLVDEPVRLPRMVERVGLSIGGIGKSELAIHLPTASRLCFKCKSKTECDAWLAIGEERTDPPDFCLNKGYLRLARRIVDVPY